MSSRLGVGEEDTGFRARVLGGLGRSDADNARDNPGRGAASPDRAHLGCTGHRQCDAACAKGMAVRNTTTHLRNYGGRRTTTAGTRADGARETAP